LFASLPWIINKNWQWQFLKRGWVYYLTDRYRIRISWRNEVPNDDRCPNYEFSIGLGTRDRFLQNQARVSQTNKLSSWKQDPIRIKRLVELQLNQIWFERSIKGSVSKCIRQNLIPKVPQYLNDLLLNFGLFFSVYKKSFGFDLFYGSRSIRVLRVLQPCTNKFIVGWYHQIRPNKQMHWSRCHQYGISIYIISTALQALVRSISLSLWDLAVPNTTWSL